jgi:hypothetical protein
MPSALPVMAVARRARMPLRSAAHGCSPESTDTRRFAGHSKDPVNRSLTLRAADRAGAVECVSEVESSPPAPPPQVGRPARRAPGARTRGLRGPVRNAGLGPRPRTPCSPAGHQPPGIDLLGLVQARTDDGCGRSRLRARPSRREPRRRVGVDGAGPIGARERLRRDSLGETVRPVLVHAASAVAPARSRSPRRRSGRRAGRRAGADADPRTASGFSPSSRRRPRKGRWRPWIASGAARWGEEARSLARTRPRGPPARAGFRRC